MSVSLVYLHFLNVFLSMSGYKKGPVVSMGVQDFFRNFVRVPLWGLPC